MIEHIQVCQATVCQNKGSKGVLHRLQTVFQERFMEKYPQLVIESFDCMGDCEQGPIVKVNDRLLLRNMDNYKAQQLLEDPETFLHDVVDVHENDHVVFDRIASGDLF